MIRNLTEEEESTTQDLSHSQEDLSQHSTRLPTLYLEHGFQDHFSVSAESSFFRSTSREFMARIIDDQESSQFLLEEFKARRRMTMTTTIVDQASHRHHHHQHDRTSVHIRKIPQGGRLAKNLLKAVYLFGIIFWAGIFFMISLEILLFVLLEMVSTQIYTPAENQTFRYVQLVGFTLGMFSFCYGLATGLVLAGAFVVDIWSGQSLLKLFCNTTIHQDRGGLVVDWMYFIWMILLPVLGLCITLLVQRNVAAAWSICLLIWYGSVSVLFIIFTIMGCSCEIQCAWQLVPLTENADMVVLHEFWQRVKTCVLLKQTAVYSGYATEQYVAYAEDANICRDVTACVETPDDETISSLSILDWTRQTSIGPWSRFTKWILVSTTTTTTPQHCWARHFFSPVDPPERIQSLEDVLQARHYVTTKNWTLERLFLWPKRSSSGIVLVRGPEALTDGQLRSSLAWSVTVLFMGVLIGISMLVWMQLSSVTISVGIILVCCLACIPLFKDLFASILMTRKILKGTIKKQDEPDLTLHRTIGSSPNHVQLPTNRRAASESNQGMFLVSKRMRVARATECFCWGTLTAEILLFLVYPLVTISVAGNIPLAILFFCVVGTSGLRYYIDVVAVAEETGLTNTIQLRRESSTGSCNDLALLTVLSHMMKNRKCRSLARLIFVGCSMIGLIILVAASQQSIESTSKSALTLLDGFHWEPDEEYKFPSCDPSNQHSFGPNLTLADFAFVTILPYQTDAVAASQVQEWFINHQINVVEDPQTVREFREENHLDLSPVFFRLFRFSLENGNGKNERGIISIRGSQNNWEILADLQLWSAAMLCQGLRVVLPIGGVWTPIFDEIISLVSVLRGTNVKEMAFYKVTTSFALALKKDETLDELYLTGHSLGGGLAIISGAQARIPSVALSGPNAMLMGKSFQPKVYPDQLNKYTFNIVPDKDLMPRLDDLAQNYQRIHCHASKYAFLQCHDYVRSLCEIVTTCGNENRPAICDCVYDYGYPMPTVIDPNTTTTTFEEACQAQGYVPTIKRMPW